MSFLTAEQIKAVMMGHAIGDALGVPVEFCSRKELDLNPVTDMRGYGTYAVPAGSWSDDTSMSLCALDVLKEGTADYDAIMKNFGKWYYEGKFTPGGQVFDIGNTCSIAISRYFSERKPYSECGLKEEYSNGNGSLMRIHPFVLYLADKKIPLEKKMDIVHIGSSLTHAHELSETVCGMYAFVLWELLRRPCKDSVISGLHKADEYYKNKTKVQEGLFSRVSTLYRSTEKIAFDLLPREEIKSTGYAPDSFEAAIWCVLNTESYSDCVLSAVNLGDDSDTVGAVAGGLAGALYGYENIPEEWKEKLIASKEIEAMCERAFSVWVRRNG